MDEMGRLLAKPSFQVRRLAALAALSLGLLLAAVSHAGAQGNVDLQLVLAVDVSGSVSEARFELQKRGYVAAFRDLRLLQAIQSGSQQRIAVTMLQWTGPVLQVQVVPWRLISGEASLHALADAIESTPRRLFGGGTSISGAIDYAMSLFAAANGQGGRRVIDVSGDGTNNRGRPVNEARDDAVRAGVSINGLPILALDPDLDQYYVHNVIGGPSAFVVAAASYETFAEAILKKLVTEIAAAPPRGVATRLAKLMSRRLRPQAASLSRLTGSSAIAPAIACSLRLWGSAALRHPARALRPRERR
jgi:uncharacterized protein DUF1194